MAGILDNKQRIIDAIITDVGLGQMASGDLKVKFYSFSDANVLYEQDLLEGAVDATQKFYFEQSKLNRDKITITSNDEGNILPFNTLNNSIQNGMMLSHELVEKTDLFSTSSIQSVGVISGSCLHYSASLLFDESLQNFKKLQILSSKDTVFDDDGFGVSKNDITFNIQNDLPISSEDHIVSLSSLENMFIDSRFSNVQNFKYLPPINKINDSSISTEKFTETSEHHLGNYSPLGRTQLQKLDWKQIDEELKHYERNGYMKTINFDPTSKNNNLLIQMFSRTHSVLKKLDIINYGTLQTANPQAPLVDVYFIGKLNVASDPASSHSFSHFFTLVFE